MTKKREIIKEKEKKIMFITRSKSRLRLIPENSYKVPSIYMYSILVIL
jgi:hypothetical protein